jgi:hypothetical protein
MPTTGTPEQPAEIQRRILIRLDRIYWLRHSWLRRPWDLGRWRRVTREQKTLYEQIAADARRLGA